MGLGNGYQLQVSRVCERQARQGYRPGELLLPGFIQEGAVGEQ